MSAVIVSGGRIVGSGGSVCAQLSGNTDFSWSATVTGSEKSAAAGFIAPVIFNNGNTGNSPSYQGGRIFPVTGACTVDVYYERVLGDTGSISVTISTFDSTNATAGTNYTSVAGTVLSWADGEIGWKKVSITVLAIPTGFGLVGITCSGAAAYRPTSWIWLQGTGLVPGAKFFQSSNGVNVNGNVSGSGTAGSPWLGLANAIASMGASGGVLYWVQSGTNGHMEWGGTAGTSNGVVVNGFSAANSAPLIILPHPSNTSQAFMDQGSTAGGANILWSNAAGLYFKGTGAGIWLVGIHFYRGGVQWNGQDVTQWSNTVVWQCEVDNYAVSAGSNVHCIRFEHVVNGIFQDCYVHNSYTNETFSSNSYDSLASGFEACFGTLRPSFCTVAHCFMEFGQYALMNKQGPDTSTDTPCEITHCLALKCQASTSSGGGLTGYPVQGTGFSNALIRYCVYDGTNDLGPVGGSFITQFDDISQAQNLDIFNCVTICGANGGGGIGELKGATGWRVFNNISQASTTNEINVESPGTGKTSQLLFCDKNMYVRGAHTWVAAGTSYTSAGAWQAAGPNSILAVTGNDANSVFTSTTPSYTNLAANDYRINNSGGRGNRPIGVGNELCGVVNNFLNSSLPVVT